MVSKTPKSLYIPSPSKFVRGKKMEAKSEVTKGDMSAEIGLNNKRFKQDIF